MHKLTQWLESVDPYYTSRIILRRGLFVAILMSFVNMIVKPDVFLGFALPAIIAFGCYESYIFNSFFQKNKALTVAFVLFTIVAALFYFLYDYKFYLLITTLCFYSVIYWLIYYRFFEFKPFITLVLTFASFMSLILPSGSLQIGTNIFYCIMLSLLTLFTAIIIHPNLYHHVWYRATKLYLIHLENSIENAIHKKNQNDYMNELSHAQTIKNYKHLLPKKNLLNRMRINFHMHNINFILKHLYDSDKNIEFWLSTKEQIHEFRMAMNAERMCALKNFITTQDKNEKSVQKHLRLAISSWNTLCLQH